ncbi:hypothetical protein KIH27_15975 [Mycobacterium sp. M1]|uniref:Uncharacterized protein n=1 Tax=Mycolicibacter acidiphilus TaxID=2835306 RepID=A0ABS5RNM7_9MYCO|nr:hypothetical protein [Mycolicibacter acidiphilus]MBS9535086.1 hypothetical protein [Mycolicibacter acidiphilus]
MTTPTEVASYLGTMTELLEAQGMPFPDAAVQAINDARVDPDAPVIDSAAVRAFCTMAMAEWRKRGATGDTYLRLLDRLGAFVIAI